MSDQSSSQESSDATQRQSDPDLLDTDLRDTELAGGAPLGSVREAKEAAKSHNVFSRLSTGTGAFDILGHRKWYYVFSSCLIVLSILFMLLRGFNLSLDFVGGTQLTMSPNGAVSHTQVTQVIHDSIGVDTDSVVDVGSDVEIDLPKIDQDQVVKAEKALVSAFHLPSNVTKSDVSGTWGNTISEHALISVIVFLIAVAIFIWVRYEHRVAIGAVLSVLHDLVVAAGVYALIGFQVAPATVIGLLTILGFSLYDTVVVYDKVEENIKGLTSLLRRTYDEAANLAINQTLMRSINTSLTALLPVAGLLIAGIALLGSGVLKDLSLIMLIGMLIGAYSSVFLAVPMAVDFKLRDPVIARHTQRVKAKRDADGLIVDADGDPIGRRETTAAGEPVAAGTRPHRTSMPGTQAEPASPKLTPGSGPLPGVKPVRPGGKPSRVGSSPAPSGKSSRAKAAGPVGKRSR